MCLVAETVKTRIPGEQRFWLVLHWFALVQTLYLATVAILNSAPAYSVLITVLALVAMATAVYFAMRIARRHVTTQQFVKWTTTGRVLAVGWSFIGVLLFVVPVLSAFVELDVTNSSWTSGVIGAIGSVSALAMIGPGYAEFREALAHDAS